VNCCALRVIGKICIQPPDLLPILHVAWFYEVFQLKAECAELLFNALGENRVWALVNIAEMYSLTQLQVEKNRPEHENGKFATVSDD